MHEKMMSRCLELALKGIGLVAPNPMVGCVIVRGDKIISEGYHHRYGGPHAERVAIEQLKDKQLLKDASLYVNLEPCSHHGKTPPCADLIIDSGIKSVYVGDTDPNPLVSGKGIQKLKDAGISVEVGILREEARYLNRRFLCYQKNKRPYVILKWAVSSDGFMDLERDSNEDPHINWITGSSLQQQVHKWRAEEPAILVGGRTVVNDNPQLTCRRWPGNNPLRVVIDSRGNLSAGLAIFDEAASSLIISNASNESNHDVSGVEFQYVEEISPESILEQLYARGIQSVIIEGGRKTLDMFIQSGLWDEARVLTGTREFNAGLKGPEIHGDLKNRTDFGGETLEIFFK